jgi:hypothetical protein
VGAIRVAVEKASHNIPSKELAETDSLEEKSGLQSLAGGASGGDNGSLSQIVDPNGTARNEGDMVPPISI